MIVTANYNNEFICNLLKQVDNKVALGADKDYKNSIYVLGLKTNLDHYEELTELSEILNRVLKCEDCYKDLDIEDIVNKVKNKLNKC